MYQAAQMFSFKTKLLSITSTVFCKQFCLTDTLDDTKKQIPNLKLFAQQCCDFNLHRFNILK